MQGTRRKSRSSKTEPCVNTAAINQSINQSICGDSCEMRRDGDVRDFVSIGAISKTKAGGW
jgi:hypothetical protein